MKRNEAKHTVKTIEHTIEYLFGSEKTIKRVTVLLNIIRHTYEEYTTSSTGAKGYSRQHKTLIQTDDKSFSIHADEASIKDGYHDHAIIEAVTGDYYNDVVGTYFKSVKALF